MGHIQPSYKSVTSAGGKLFEDSELFNSEGEEAICDMETDTLSWPLRMTQRITGWDLDHSFGE